jgi:hypothetical protein
MKVSEKKLLKFFRSLDDSQRELIVSFAEFLSEKYAQTSSTEIIEPQEIPRPENESVIKAIQRLSQSYHMLDKDELFNETSTLMTQHIMNGRDVVEVIDELEDLFQQHYERHVNERKSRQQDHEPASVADLFADDD